MIEYLALECDRLAAKINAVASADDDERTVSRSDAQQSPQTAMARLRLQVRHPLTHIHMYTYTHKHKSIRTHTYTWIHKYIHIDTHTHSHAEKSSSLISLPLEGTCRTYRNPGPSTCRNDERTGTYYFDKIHYPVTSQVMSYRTMPCNTMLRRGNFIVISRYIHFHIDFVASFFDTSQMQYHTAVKRWEKYSAIRCTVLQLIIFQCMTLLGSGQSRVLSREAAQRYEPPPTSGKPNIIKGSIKCFNLLLLITQVLSFTHSHILNWRIF